jgi:hypothetical protein
VRTGLRGAVSARGLRAGPEERRREEDEEEVGAGGVTKRAEGCWKRA